VTCGDLNLQMYSDEDKQQLKMKQKQKQIEFQEKMRQKLNQFNSPTAEYLSELFHLCLVLLSRELSPCVLVLVS